jgi:hypothetical protein
MEREDSYLLGKTCSEAKKSKGALVSIASAIHVIGVSHLKREEVCI